MKFILFLCIFCQTCIIVFGAKPNLPRCLEANRLLFRNLPPFSNNITGKGIVERIFKLSMQSCCIGNNLDHTHLQFKTQSDIPDLLIDHDTRHSFDFIIPVQRDVRINNYLIYPFVPLIASPGFAVFVIPSQDAAMAVFNAVKSIIPLITVVMLFVVIGGTFFWIIESFSLAWNGEKHEQFPQGIIDGIWWAFVTMTTVGYGDQVPRTLCGRLFSFIWVLAGLVVCGLIISTLTTSIVVAVTKNEIDLVDKEIAVIRGSNAYRYVSKIQGKPYQYDTIEEIVNALRKEVVRIALVDSMVAGYHQELLSEFTLNKIIEQMSMLGVIFLNDGQKYEKCVRQFTYDNQNEILEQVAANVRIMEFKSKIGENTDFVDPSLPIVRNGFIVLFVTIGAFFTLGMTVDYHAKKRLRKSYEANPEKAKQERESLKIEMINQIMMFREKCDSLIMKLDCQRLRHICVK